MTRVFALSRQGTQQKTIFWLGALAVSMLMAVSSNSSLAQIRGMSTVMELGGSKLAVSPDEMRALSDVGNLIRSGQQSQLNRALAKARRVSNSRDARYALALYELEIGKRRGDDAMRAHALDVLIASQLSPRGSLPSHLAARGQIAFKAGEFEKADALWKRLADLTPGDPNALANLAQVKLAQEDARSAHDLITRAIVLREANQARAPETWYRQRLSIAQQGRLVTPGMAAARALVVTYPSPSNWRAALIVYRDLAAPSGPAEVDLLRFMRRAGALSQAAEYQRMAQLLRLDGQASEAKAVLNEGLASGLLDARASPTREIIAEVDRSLALLPSKSGAMRVPVSQAGAQIRQGFARLQAGRQAEAEAVFRAVANDPKGGHYADLAFFWLAFLNAGAAPIGGTS